MQLYGAFARLLLKFNSKGSRSNEGRAARVTRDRSQLTESLERGTEDRAIRRNEASGWRKVGTTRSDSEFGSGPEASVLVTRVGNRSALIAKRIRHWRPINSGP